MVAYRVAHAITQNPAIRVLYVSATSNLAVKQIKFIKDILTNDIYRFYWPEMVNLEESKREKWTETEISVDHPRRKEEVVRDPTVFTSGLTTTITGLHCDIAVLDDIVIRENAYTEEGREKVKSQHSLLASIEGTDALEWVVGTRYHPNDLYNDLVRTNVDIYNSSGQIISSEPLYETFERKVETIGDGSGQFLWPIQQRADGKWFGFDAGILAKKRAQYHDRTQFRAQYYNDPNDSETAAISRQYFQYFDPKHLHRSDGKWYYKHSRLNLFASIDFAFSLNKKSDYTAICVVGVDTKMNYYVLDISRFKTNLISEYFKEILSLHGKWDFRKLKAEITGGQETIVNDLKVNYIRPYGLALSIDDHRPNRYMGTKEERIDAVLQPRYSNFQMWHYQGGNCQILEDELVLQHPPHDDVKDALASAVEACVAPSSMASQFKQQESVSQMVNSRFGGLL